MSADLNLDGWFADAQHIYPLRVQYEDTDAGGVVYHACYLAYAERARSAAFTLLAIDQMALLAEGVAFVVANLSIRYQQAAALGDVLQVVTTATAISRASIKLTQTITGVPKDLPSNSSSDSPQKLPKKLYSDSPIATLEVTIVQTRIGDSSEGQGKTGGIVRISDEVIALVRANFSSCQRVTKK